MMEWRDENDRMEDDKRMMKNGEIGQSGNRVKMRDWLKKREKI